MQKIQITKSIVPNLLTLGNIFSGFTAIIYIANGNYKLGTFYIIMAAVFDMLDGIIARLLRATSEIGAMLDSLCDAVSFGVAPSFMLYKVFFYQYGDFGILFAALPTLAGVYRLARFNVQLTSFDDKLYFYGLPIPGGALTIISFINSYLNNNVFSSQITEILTFSVSIIVSLAMISTIKFNNMPRPTKQSFKSNPIMFIGVLMAIALACMTEGKSLFPTMILYITIATIKTLYNKIVYLLKNKQSL